MNTEENKACVEATFQFTVKNIKDHKGATLCSPSYFVQNLPWKIVVMPFYHGQKSLGVFLQCDGVRENSLWTCNAKATLKLLSVTGKKISVIRDLQHEFCNKCNRMGFPNFISWNEMLKPKNGYAPNYIITLEVHIVADIPKVEEIALYLKRTTENYSFDSPLRPSKLRKVEANESISDKNTGTANKWRQSEQETTSCTSLQETTGKTRIRTEETSDNHCNNEGNGRAEGIFQYTVHNIRNLKGIRLCSPPYYVKNLPWKIVVMPFCMSFYVSNFQRCLGVFLQCDGDPENLLWACKAKADIKLISHTGNRISVTRSLEHVFCSQDYRNGFSSFVSWSDLLKPASGYVMHDTITLEAHIVADAPCNVGGTSAVQKSPCDLIRSTKNFSDSSLHINELKKSTAGEVQNTNDTAEQPREEEEEDKEEKTSVLIEKADKYFTALKNLFTAKMLSNKLDVPEVLQEVLQKEVSQIEKEMQEFVQHDKELQRQWQLWHQK